MVNSFTTFIYHTLNIQWFTKYWPNRSRCFVSVYILQLSPNFSFLFCVSLSFIHSFMRFCRSTWRRPWKQSYMCVCVSMSVSVCANSVNIFAHWNWTGQLWNEIPVKPCHCYAIRWSMLMNNLIVAFVFTIHWLRFLPLLLLIVMMRFLWFLKTNRECVFVYVWEKREREREREREWLVWFALPQYERK